MKRLITITIFIIILLVSVNMVHAQQNNVAVIAHSTPAMQEARKILKRLGWVAVSLKQADGVLVVCSSNLSYPLNSTYRNVSDLNNDASLWTALSSRRFHVYLYIINNDLSVLELDHVDYTID